MKATKRVIISLIFSLQTVFYSGCAIYTRTLNDAEAARGTGVTRQYQKSYDSVWKAVTASVASSSLVVTSSSRVNGKILAIGEQTAFSYGEFVAIYVQDIDGHSNTKVEIISIAKKSNNISATNWAEKLFSKIDQENLHK